MYKVYVPYEDTSLFNNYYFNNDLSLIYATNDNTNFDIIDINNHYTIVNSNVDINNLVLYKIDNSNIVNNWTYRSDLPAIFISLFFMCLFFIGIPLFLLSRFFKKRW